MHVTTEADTCRKYVLPRVYLDGLAGQVSVLARLQTETAAELDALLPSVLDKAFKGEL